MINIKEILEKEGPLRKYKGIAPEGFILLCEKTIEDLKNYDIWKSWVDGKISLDDLNKENYDK
jgi:hypothetical protein